MKWFPLMPRVPIIVPDLGSDRIRLSLWYVQAGDRVYEGDRVVELLIPGASFDVSAPAPGVLVDRVASPNDALVFGQQLGAIQAETETM